jgi:cysteine-rich repeat protein
VRYLFVLAFAGCGVPADLGPDEETPRCGDGRNDESEECDDANTGDGDGCSATCRVEFCGDGLLQAALGEECDAESVTCVGCLVALCGDGRETLDEQCDDGNSDNEDGCSSACDDEYCGDGTVQAGLGENCDPSNATDCFDCRAPVCGDDDLTPNEECDDGNTEDNDGCNSVCDREVCGDDVVQTALGEECDDSNDDNGDDCADCRAARCGDAALHNGIEECDDGNEESGDGCDALCVDESCGDGIRNDAHRELCDDGNPVDDDGCSNTCNAGVTCSDLGSLGATCFHLETRSGFSEPVSGLAILEETPRFLELALDGRAPAVRMTLSGDERTEIFYPNEDPRLIVAIEEPTGKEIIGVGGPQYFSVERASESGVMHLSDGFFDDTPVEVVRLGFFLVESEEPDMIGVTSDGFVLLTDAFQIGFRGGDLDITNPTGAATVLVGEATFVVSSAEGLAFAHFTSQSPGMPGLIVDDGALAVGAVRDVVAFDFDEDGDDDVIDLLDGSDAIEVRLTEGSVIADPVVLAPANGARTMELFDFDGDGKSDILTVETRGMIRALLSSEAYASFDLVPAPAEASRIVTSDIDEDGDLDILIGGRGTDGDGAVFLWQQQ